MSKILIAYFSASGVTGRAAKEIAEAVGADLYEIRPEQPYTAADLDWRNKQSRSSLEMTDPDSRPAMAGPMPDLGEYDTVFVGFPIWWGVEPRVVDTFLDRNGFEGKTMIPFATSGGSGVENAAAHLKELYPAADWRPGKLLRRGNAAAWAKTL